MPADPATLDDVIATYLEAIDTDRVVDPDAFIAEWPEHREAFLRFVADSGQLEQLIDSPDRIPVSSAGRSLPDRAQLGGFRVSHVLGRGGMGIVYLAHRIEDELPVALKVLHPASMASLTHQQRFDREARVIESLDHPHIVPLYAAGQDGDERFLAMELIDGVTLADMIGAFQAEDGTICSNAADAHCDTAARTPLSNRSIYACFAQARQESDEAYFHTIARFVAESAGAVEAAHERGIVHRDIKPSNLIVDVDGKLWLTDFGLASLGNDETVVTETGDLLGTPAYMSPEQALGSHQLVDQRTDVYSLGATLYELATLQKPFQGERFRVLRDVSQGNLKPPSSRREIPRPLEAIILKAMAHQPAQRYQKSSALAADLRHFVAGEPIAVRVPGVTDRAVRWMNNHPGTTFAWIGASVACVLMVIGIQLFNSARLARINTTLGATNQTLENTNAELSRVNADLTTSQRELRRHLYIADMSAAYRAYGQHDVDAVRQRLTRHVPESGETDQRGFEWWLLYNLTRPPEKTTFAGHQGAAREATLIPGTNQFLSAGDDGFLRRWDTETGQQVGQIEIGGRLDALAVSPDGQTVVTGQNIPEGTNPVTLRDLATGEVLRELSGHDYSVESAAFSPDGRWVATAGRYNDVLVHSIEGELVTRLTTDSRNESLAFSSDGPHLLAISREGEGDPTPQFLRTWLLADFNRTNRYGEPLSPLVFDVAREPGLVVMADGDTMAIVRWPGGKTVASQDMIRGRIRDVAISSDGKFVAAGCDNGVLYRWQFARPQSTMETPAGQFPPPITVHAANAKLTSVTFVRQGDVLATCEDGSVHLWNFGAGETVPVEAIDARAMAASLHWPGDLYFYLDDGTITRFDQTTNSVQDLAKLPVGTGHLLALSPDEATLVAVSSAGIALISTATREVRDATPDSLRDQRCHSLEFHPDGSRFFGLYRHSLLVFETEDALLLNHLSLDTESGSRLAISPDQSALVVVTKPQLVFLDLNTLERRLVIEERFGGLSIVAYSDSGQWLAVGHEDGTIQLLDAANLSTHATLRGHGAFIAELLFTSDDQTLITSDAARSIRIWDVESGRELGMLRSEIGDAMGVHLSEPHQTLITYGVDRPLQIFNAQRE